MRRAGLSLLTALCGFAAEAESSRIILQSTTSAQNSGLYDAILPQFTAESGIDVRVVAVGSGQALRQASDCNGEAVIVHDPAAEKAFLDAGFASRRFDLMRNDFVIVGPEKDPAEIAVAGSAAEAFARIAAGRHPFVSRGDDSGTHSRETEIWSQAGIVPQGSWLRETGAGMGATLNIAAGMDAYTLTDRATWIRFGNKLNHEIHFEGGDDLLNLYSVMVVDAARCRGINSAGARIFLNWLLSEAGQKAIGAFSVNGMQLFEPVAPPR